MNFQQKFYNLLKASPRCVNEGVFISSLNKDELDYFFSALSETAKKNIIKGEYVPNFEPTRNDILDYVARYFDELKIEEVDVSFVNYLLKRNLLTKSILITYIDKFDHALLGNIITNSRELRCDKDLQLLIMANNYGNDAYLDFLKDHMPKNAKLWKMRNYSIEAIMKHRKLFNAERVLSTYFNKDNLVLFNIEQMVALVANIKTNNFMNKDTIEIKKLDNPDPYKNVYGRILELLLKLLRKRSKNQDANSKYATKQYIMIYVQIAEINNQLENLSKVPIINNRDEYLPFVHMIPKKDYEILKEFKPDLTLVTPNVRAIQIKYDLYYESQFEQIIKEASKIAGTTLLYYDDSGDWERHRAFYIINPNDRSDVPSKSLDPDYVIEELDANKIGNLFKGAYDHGEYLNIGSDVLNKSFCDSYGIPEQVLVM